MARPGQRSGSALTIIGEKVNATRKSVAKAIEDRDEGFIAALVKSQDEAGARVIDLNAGAGDPARSEDDMRWLVQVALAATDRALAADSEVPRVLEAALEAMGQREKWINSISAEKARLEGVLPLAQRHGAPMVALMMDDAGIPGDMAGRMKAAGAIYRAAADAGLDPGQLYFDPLVMPVGAQPQAGALALDCIRAVKKEFPGAKTVLGLSNVSFGLPMRGQLNATYLVLCMGAGLDAAICDPASGGLMAGIFAAEALLGQDPFCGRFIRDFRQQSRQGSQS